MSAPRPLRSHASSKEFPALLRPLPLEKLALSQEAPAAQLATRAPSTGPWAAQSVVARNLPAAGPVSSSAASIARSSTGPRLPRLSVRDERKRNLPALGVVVHCYRARTEWELDAIPGQWVMVESESAADRQYLWARVIAGHTKSANAPVDQGRGWIHAWYLDVVRPIGNRTEQQQQQQEQQQLQGRLQEKEECHRSNDDKESLAAVLETEARNLIMDFYRRMLQVQAAVLLSAVPLLVRFEKFIDGACCRALIDAANEQEFSLDMAGVVGTEQLSARTSEGQWLYPKSSHSLYSSSSSSSSSSGGGGGGESSSNDSNQTRTTFVGGCHDDALNSVIMTIEAKVAAVSRQPASHQEPLHLVRYKPGQEYRAHVDAVEAHGREIHGPRLSTVLIYLNDCADGGSTAFVDLDLEVRPSAGAAIFWHNVCPPTSASSSQSNGSEEKAKLKATPPPPQKMKPSSLLRCDVSSSETAHLQPDDRLTHAAKPITRGEKYVAIKWVHALPFQGC